MITWSNGAWEVAAAPSLSVLVPFRNDDCRPLVASLLEAGAALDAAIEIVVAEDCADSPAAREQLQASFEASAIPAAIFVAERNLGRSAIRNRLAQIARAKYLLFIDAGMDISGADYLRRYLALCEEGRPRFVFGGYTARSAALEHSDVLAVREFEDAQSRPATLRRHRPWQYAYAGNLLVHRDVMADHPFDEGFRGWGWEDIELCIRVGRTLPIWHIDNPVVRTTLPSAAELCRRLDESGHNFARIVALHPVEVGHLRIFKAARFAARVWGRGHLRRPLRWLATREGSTISARIRLLAFKLYRACVYADAMASRGVARAAWDPLLERAPSPPMIPPPDSGQVERRTRIFGIDVHVVDQQAAVEHIVHCSCSADFEQGPHRVATVNLHHVLLARAPGPFRDAIRDCELVLADGMPLVWSSWLSRYVLPERVTGADLVLPVCQKAARAGASVFILGTTLPILAQACRELAALCPGLKIAGVYAPPEQFHAGHPLSEEAISMIANCRPTVLFLALGAPKQEVWMHAHWARLCTRAVICAGASFDFIAGSQIRAPKPMQRTGLEWLWRLMMSPRRLGARYGAVLALLPILLLEQCRDFIGEHVAQRKRPVAPSSGRIERDDTQARSSDCSLHFSNGQAHRGS